MGKSKIEVTMARTETLFIEFEMDYARIAAKVIALLPTLDVYHLKAMLMDRTSLFQPLTAERIEAHVKHWKADPEYARLVAGKV